MGTSPRNLQVRRKKAKRNTQTVQQDFLEDFLGEVDLYLTVSKGEMSQETEDKLVATK